MSPITQEARDRILRYLQDHTVPNEPPPYKPHLLERLLDNLIAAARHDPFDAPF